ncbi:MAG TPA: host attachment protein [Thermodesulfovibrionales bacterium]|nr:host attachment protein [Thermodesulfovibrionales bacterium]
MTSMIITVDLGHFKAYRVTTDSAVSPRTDLVEMHDIFEGHGKLSERLSDSAGRFRGGGGKDEFAKGYGEPHNLESEISRRVMKTIATDINRLVKREGCESWYFAAGDKINRGIIEKLDPEVKSRLRKNMPADLTKVRKSEILDHFK